MRCHSRAMIISCHHHPHHHQHIISQILYPFFFSASLNKTPLRITSHNIRSHYHSLMSIRPFRLLHFVHCPFFAFGIDSPVACLSLTVSAPAAAAANILIYYYAFTITILEWIIVIIIVNLSMIIHSSSDVCR